MQTFNNNVLGKGRYVHGPVPGTHSLDANGSPSMGDDATDTVDNVRGSANRMPGSKQNPSSMPIGPGNPAPAFFHTQVALDSSPHNSAGFHFNAQPPAMYADQPQIAQHVADATGGASAMNPLAIQSIMNPDGSSQPQPLALQAPEVSPQNIFMHVVPHVPGSHPGYFSAQDGQPAPTGMQPMAPTMVPAHLVQSMMPLVNGSTAMHMPGMPLATGANGAVPMHAGLQTSIPTMHAVGTPLHGSFPPADLMDCAVAVEHGGDLQLHQQSPMVSEPASMDPTSTNNTAHSVLMGSNAASGLRSGAGTGKRARQRAAPAAPSRTGSAGQHSPRDPRAGAEVSGARSGGGGGGCTAGEEEESVVEKRLKQNREAARRSRDRKRRLKEEIRGRIPVLQEEHDSLSNQVQQLMKHLWSSKEGLLSPPMQELMLHQSVYLERCAALRKILESSEDGPLEAGLHDVDCAWGELNAAFDRIKTTYELFLVLNSANAPPTHNMWFHLGGMKLSCVVRTFMQLPMSAVDAHASATLARLVEGWTFHETLLEHGKKVLQRGLLEACVQVGSQAYADQDFAMSARIDGFLDTLTELVCPRTLHTGTFNSHYVKLTVVRPARDEHECRVSSLGNLLLDQVELLDAHALFKSLPGSQGLSEADRVGEDSPGD